MEERFENNPIIQTKTSKDLENEKKDWKPMKEVASSMNFFQNCIDSFLMLDFLLCKE
jgi:hypothetical protein